MKQKPPPYRLTLKDETAIKAFSQMMASFKAPRPTVGISRPDGKYDVAISHSLMDQLQTAALPKENLSDTVLRIMAKASS